MFILNHLKTLLVGYNVREEILSVACRVIPVIRVYFTFRNVKRDVFSIHVFKELLSCGPEKVIV